MKPNTRVVLALLRINPDGITSLECLNQGGGFRLSGRIHELREAGYDIENLWETVDGARFVRYVLAEKPVQLTAHF
jgi:hypothetical protein